MIHVATTAGLVVFAAITTFFLAIALTTLRWMIHGWSTPERALDRVIGDGTTEPIHSFSLIVAARDEAAVLGETLLRLADQTHPRVEIIAVVGADDRPTLEVAEAAARLRPDRIVVVHDTSEVASKPASLNSGLAACSGDIVGVFDAEDDVAPGLLVAIDGELQRTNAHIIQSGVQLMNLDSRWFATRNVLEYYFHFGSRLHHHANQAFIPLGGNTVFIRRSVLELVNGWDTDCLAEDCELGIRLSVRGARTVAVYQPDLVTREEAPTDLRTFVRQRTRWDQGFMQVLRKGEWRRLPERSQRMAACWMLAMPFIQATAIPLGIVQIGLAATLDVPIGLALYAFTPLALTVLTIMVELAGLHEFTDTFDIRLRPSRYLAVIVGFVPYNLLLTWAAGRATIRELRGRRGWEKTSHTGAHRSRIIDLTDNAVVPGTSHGGPGSLAGSLAGSLSEMPS